MSRTNILLLLMFIGIFPFVLASEVHANPVHANGPNIMVYINWDGFANYYVDLAEQQNKIPTLSKIKNEEGVYFSNAYTGVPSITNPIQASIASGTTPKFTDNHYRYFNKKLNSILQEQPARKNEAETLAEAAVRQNLEIISINQFAFQDRGTVSGDPAKAYISSPIGLNGYSDATARFDEAIRIITTLKSGNLSLERVPQLIALYMDDLDGIGHNESATYGVAPVTTEAARQQAVVDRLAVMDSKLGELIQACKDAGIYHRMSFVLTTDHGMAPFGSPQLEPDDRAKSKMPDLIASIEALGVGYQCEKLHPSQTQVPSAETNIAVVTVGLQVQLSYVGEFDPEVIYTKNQKIYEALKSKEYIDQIMFPDQTARQGVKAGFADLIISPKPPYHFQLSDTYLAIARGQHDSLAEEVRHIASFMWGKHIKKGYTCKEPVFNSDFAPTMATLLGINAPLDATAQILYCALEHVKPVWKYPVTSEDQEAVGRETVPCVKADDPCENPTANGDDSLESIEFTKVPAAKKMIVKYATVDDSRLELYLNDSFVRTVFFPSSGNSTTNYADKIINLTLHRGDTLRFVNPTAGDSHGHGIMIDCIFFDAQSK